MFHFSIITTHLLPIFFALYALLVGKADARVQLRLSRLYLLTNITIFSLLVFAYQFGQEMILMQGLFYVDQLSILLHGFIVFLMIVGLLMGQGSWTHPSEQMKYMKYMVLFQNVLCLVLISQQFVITFIGLVAATICLYPLILDNTIPSIGNEIALKYMLQSALGMAFALLGLSLLYGSLGTLFMNEMRVEILGQPAFALTTLGALLFLLGIMMKAGKAPLHFWMVDLFYGAPFIVVLLSALVMKVVLMTLYLSFMRILAWSGPQEIVYFIKAIAYTSILWGSVSAFEQKNVMRFIAYSSIAQMGFVFLSGLEPNGNGLYTCLAFFFIYALAFLGILLSLSLLKISMPYIENIHDLAGLHKKSPVITLVFTIFLLSLAGLPPVAGFFTKYYLLQSLVNIEDYLSVAVVLLGSFLGVMFYLNIIKIIYFEEPRNSGNKTNLMYNISSPLHVILISIGFLIMFYPFVGGYFQDILLNALNPYRV